ncbi:hypothetical protein AYM40_23195 [Paraburkholderia phytofirmans OLGA172]|uniref:PPC domain-containing protein n=1 Tax=Paraburkholderia phytofirmans OLGA172 TaxID=1417228 RepID=A0A160FRU6_9BURK|nr:hypothetical protein [Paraburkholderia phytofirmans]ANB75298.1 hypothetical protein AYM40_23195 [Paraburkholderia phytofirmans OLGA172]
MAKATADPRGSAWIGTYFRLAFFLPLDGNHDLEAEIMLQAAHKSEQVSESRARAKRFTHPGTACAPRVVDVTTTTGTRDLRISLPALASVGPALHRVLDAYPNSGGCGRIVYGLCGTIQYHVMTKATQGVKPFVYGAPILCALECTLITAAITIGHRGDGKRILHCHGGFLDSSGTQHGGHIILDETVVAGSPMIVRLCLFEQVDLVASPDHETTFDLLLPIKVR